MQICAILILAVCLAQLISADYHRIKVRGHPRPPPIPPFVKKYFPPPPPRNSLRPRPLPGYHMKHKPPLGVPPPLGSRLGPKHVNNFWKNPHITTHRTPLHEKPPQLGQEKKFQSSPKINLQQEQDYNSQTNSIAAHGNLIKQIGEKGPIHTIPAPNLSLSSKPAQEHIKNNAPAEEVKPVSQAVHQVQFIQTQPQHQYQVTEPTISFPKQQVFFAPDPGTLSASVAPATTHVQNHLPQALALYGQQKGQQANIIFNNNDQLQQTVQSQAHPKELYQILHMYTQQQPLPGFPSVPPEHMYVQPNFQALLPQQQPQLFQNPQTLLQLQQPQVNTQSIEPKISFQPEYHSFNYDEQSYQKEIKKALVPQDNFSQEDLSSLVSAAYNFDSAAAASETHEVLAPNPQESVAQSRYIQSFYNPRDGNDASNKIEPDAKPSPPVFEDVSEDKVEDDLPENFYSSLPSKEAAEALAQLQAAGKLNRNLQQMAKKIPEKTSGKASMTIFVPEEEEDKSQDQKESSEDDLNLSDQEEYEDYSEEDSKHNLASTEKTKESFGHRIKPKKNK